MTTLSRFPSFLQIEPAGACNLRCPMCPVHLRDDTGGKGSPFMSFELFRRIIDLAEGIERLHLQGMGEPLLHPRFFDMAAYAAAKGIRVTSNTNLLLLNETAASHFGEGTFDELYISMDGAVRETYESIRRGAVFERFKENLALLAGTLKRNGRQRPRLILVTVLMRRNIAELPDIIEIAENLAIDAVYTQQLSHNFVEPALRTRCAAVLDFIDKESLIGKTGCRTEQSFAAARKRAEELGVELHLPKRRFTEHRTPLTGSSWCDWPWRGLYISWRGEIMPCCMIGLPGRFSLGTVGRQPLSDKDNSVPLIRLRQRLSTGTPPGICAACAMHRGIF